jgi:hypothetical protein
VQTQQLLAWAGIRTGAISIVVGGEEGLEANLTDQWTLREK